MKKTCLALAAAVIFLTGCMGNSFKDIDKRFFVLAMGVDRANQKNQYRVTLKLAIPSLKMEPGEANSQIMSVEADSVPEAIRLLKSKVDKELDFGHTKMIVLGEDLAREDISNPIDFFVRRRDIQGIAFMAIGSPNAESVLKVNPKSETFPGNSLFLSFGENGTISAYTVTVYLFDFYRRLNENGLDPYLPVIEPEKGYYTINKVALFDKSGLKKILTPKQTKSFKELLNTNRNFDIFVSSADLKFTITAQKYHRTFKFSQSGRKIILNVNMSGVVEQSARSVFDQNWSKYEVATQKALISDYSELLQQLQLAEVDPLGLGVVFRAFHISANSDWLQWQKLYPHATFDIKVDVKLIGTGTIK